MASPPAEAAPGDFPSIAVVFYTFEMFPPGEQRRVFCGGTLVAPSAVLVAGHCVADGAADMLSGVKIGTTDLKDPAAPERNISVRTWLPLAATAGCCCWLCRIGTWPGSSAC